MKTDPHAIPDQVGLATRLFYGVGSVAEGTQNTAFNVFLLFYYSQVLGLSGTLTGAAIFIALCVDAVTDPLMGSISDNTHSRWGRRHPFMYAAAIPMSVCFYLVFNPPALGPMGLFAWLCVFAIGVRVSMTLYSIPSNSMVPELTPSYDERTSLVSYRLLFGWVGGLSIALVGFQFFFPKVGELDGRLDASAYGAFALICSGVIFLAIVTCTLGTHRLIPMLKPPPEASAFTLGRFVGELRQALSNRSYLMLVIGSIFASVAGGFSDVVGLYMNTYFWEFSTQQISILFAGLFISAFLAFAAARPISERFDKKRTLLGIALCAIFFGPLPVFLRLLGFMPENGAPSLLPLIFAHGVVLVSAVILISILIASMIADVVDENELASGKRQEGVFSAAIAFTTKATFGIGGLVAGVALDLIAFPKLAEPGSVPQEKVFLLGLAVGPGLMILFLLTLVFVSRYRLTRARHREILTELAQRAQRSEALHT